MKKRYYRALSVMLTASFIISQAAMPVHATVRDEDGLFAMDEAMGAESFFDAVEADDVQGPVEEGDAFESVDPALSANLAEIDEDEDADLPDEASFLDDNNTYQDIDFEIEESELGFFGERASTVPSLRADRATELPSSYRVDASFLPKVRDQDPFGMCWSFAAMASCEISLAKNYGLSANDLDLSERALAYFFYDLKGIDDPHKNTLNDYQTPILKDIKDIYQLGGNVMLASFFLANWGLPVDETVAPYSFLVSANSAGEKLTTDTEKGVDALDDGLCYDPLYHVQDVRFIGRDDRDGIKQAIMKNGAVTSSFYSKSMYYNAAKYAYNSGAVSPTKTNHAITLVGWDDSFSKDNFTMKPDQNGAWLIRNSYGDDYGQDGYMWISYEDQSLSKMAMISCGPKDNYKHNYFYDGSSNLDHQYGYNVNWCAANIFTASSNEILKAVSIATQSADVPYSIQVYRNLEDLDDPASGTPMLSEPVKGVTSYPGIYTIPLNKDVKLNKGDTFSVVFTIESGNKKRVYAEKDKTYSFMEAHADIHEGQSFLKSVNDDTWLDLSESNACLRIHAFTDDDPAPAADPFRNYYYVVMDGSRTVERTPVTAVNKILKMDKADGYRYFIGCTTSDVSGNCIAEFPEVVSVKDAVTTGTTRRIELVPGEVGVTGVTVSPEGTGEKKQLSFRVGEPDIKLLESVFEFNSAQDVRTDTVYVKNGYFNKVEEITVDGLDGFKADFSFDPDDPKGTITLSNTKILKTGTYSCRLKFVLAEIEEPVYKQIRIIIKDTKPVLTVSSLKSVDRLYKPEFGAGKIKISVNTGKITGAVLADTSRNGKTKGTVNPLAYEEGPIIIDPSGSTAVLDIRAKSFNPKYNKANLQVYIDGYTDPVKKDISISYMTSVLKPSVMSASVLTGPGGVVAGNEIEFKVNNTKLKRTEDFLDPAISIRNKEGEALDSRYSALYSSGTFIIKPSSGAELPAKGEEIYIAVTDDIHFETYVVSKFKVNPVHVDKMSLALSRSSLPAGYYEGETDINKGLEYLTYLKIKGCSGLNDYVRGSLIISGADKKTDDALLQGLIDAEYEGSDGSVRVSFPGGNPPAPGIYKFRLKIPSSILGPSKDVSTVLSVNVKRLDRAKAGVCKATIRGKLDVLNRTGSVNVKPVFNNLPSSYSVGEVTLTGADAGRFKIAGFGTDGMAELSLADALSYSTKTKYKVGFKYTILTGGGFITSETPVYNITVTQGKCTVKASGIDIYGTGEGIEKELIDIKVYNSLGRSIEISDVILKNPNDDFDMIMEDGQYYIIYEPNGAVKRGSSYTLKLNVILKDKAINTAVQTYNYKVKVAK